MLTKYSRGCTRPGRDFGRQVALFGLVTTAVLAAAPHPARAEAAHKDVATRASFHGVYLALGPVLAALHQPQGWDSAFGGELTVAWVDERRPLSAVGIEAGGVQLSLREAHRAWVDVLAATRIAGIAVGASVGVVADFDLVSPPRLGPQASLWVYAGVMPYVQIAHAPATGTLYVLGLKVPLPALRW